MIENLRIHNLGVIRDAEVDFAPGFTVLTGETGAGKTMIFRSLSLILGGKADPALVTTGNDTAVVEASFAVSPEIAERITETGGALDDDLAIFSRHVSVAGRGKSLIGGRAVPSSVMGELSEELVAVHGQSDQLRLTKSSAQRVLLDRFGGQATQSALAAYSTVYAELESVKAQLKSLTQDSANRAQELDRLERIFLAFDQLNPEADEDTLLDEEAKRLIHSEALTSAAQTAIVNIDGGEDDVTNVLGMLRNARKALDHESELDPALGELATRIVEIETLAADIVMDIRHYSDSVDASPERLAFVEQRRAALKQLTREFGSVNDTLAWAEQNRSRLEQLAGGDEVIEELKAKVAQLTSDREAAAKELTDARTKAAKEFQQQVSDQLTTLAMPSARVEFKIEATEPGPTGADAISLGLISRSDAPWVPLNKGASGGELSRIMLAVQVVLASSDPVGTFVFDEIDAGVGGQAALDVGKRLADLAKFAQVIVVTHLPQVAAFADRHLVIAREDGANVSSSSVSEVAESARVVELARMLAGLVDSDASNKVAEELLAVAEAYRA